MFHEDVTVPLHTSRYERGCPGRPAAAAPRARGSVLGRRSASRPSRSRVSRHETHESVLTKKNQQPACHMQPTRPYIPRVPVPYVLRVLTSRQTTAKQGGIEDEAPSREVAGHPAATAGPPGSHAARSLRLRSRRVQEGVQSRSRVAGVQSRMRGAPKPQGVAR